MPEQSEDQPNPGNTAKYRLLIVDDDDAVRNAIATWFSRKNAEVVAKDSGEDAVAAFEANPFDVVTMDIEMPGMNGVEAIRRIRSIDPAVKVVVLSGYHANSEELAGVKPNLVLAKPIGMPELEKAVQSLMA